MSDPNDLQAFLEDAWQHLARGVADSRSPARFPTLATVSPSGKPEARTVVLRAASKSAAMLQVHTDTATAKIAALRTRPHAAFHIWLPRANLQIRATATVQILSGETVEAQWAKVPSESRVSYGTVPDPGVPISDVYDYEKPADRARFAVLACTLHTVDLVDLGGRHRRAVFSADDGWSGTWVAP